MDETKQERHRDKEKCSKKVGILRSTKLQIWLEFQLVVHKSISSVLKQVFARNVKLNI